MCINKKVVAGLLLTAAAVYLLAPGLTAAALPVLLLALCPLSMVLMMKSMSRDGTADSATPHGEPGARTDTDAEIARLRNDVAELRAGGPPPSPSTPPAQQHSRD